MATILDQISDFIHLKGMLQPEKEEFTYSTFVFFATATCSNHGRVRSVTGGREVIIPSPVGHTVTDEIEDCGESETEHTGHLVIFLNLSNWGASASTSLGSG
jgi:hypothetical protein